MMRYVTLAPQYALRGWSDMPDAILDLSCNVIRGKVRILTERQREGIELLTAPGISIDDSLIPGMYRAWAEKSLKQGIFVERRKEETLADYQKYHYTKAKYTLTLLWSITGNCNLNCRHCYISSGENHYGEPSFEKCLEAMDQMLAANVNSVALTGGEPLVRRDFWKIVDALRKRHIQILQVFTNGMSVNESFLDEFEKRNINPNYFMLSFDGVGCHDWLRGVKGAEAAAVKAMKLLRQRGYELTVSTALHMGNIHSLCETYALMKELGVHTWKAVPIVDTGNWKNQDGRDIYYAEIYEKYLELLKQYRQDDAPLTLGLGGFFRCEKRQPEKWYSPFEDGCGDQSQCGHTLCESARHFPYLLPDGRVLPCIAMSGSVMEDIAPNIFEEGQSLERALYDSPIEKHIRYTYRDLFAKNKECGACEHRLRCVGCRANALAAGGYFEKDLSACEFFKGGWQEKTQAVMGGAN